MLSTKRARTTTLAILAALLGLFATDTFAQNQGGTVRRGTNAARKQPNIVVIMGDDIGMWNIGAYHRGLMAGRTPNIDKLAAEGAIFTDFYAEASCTAGRSAFVTGELPIRTGLHAVGYDRLRLLADHNLPHGNDFATFKHL